MERERPRFIKPGQQDTLYPSHSKETTIDTHIKPSTNSALIKDNDSYTNFVYNKHHFLSMEDQRRKLPIFQYRNHILYLLEKYQTLVLVGETGCGKSTQVPQYLFETGQSVCVTQCRVAAAVSLANRVAEQRSVELGKEVGYAAGPMSLYSSETKIKFVTEGVLLREMFASPLLMQYSVIMLDEVHERTLMTDVLMGLLKKIIKKRKNLKLIVSSATMQAESLRDYFNLSPNKRDIQNSTSVIMAAQGRTYPVDVFYLQEPTPDYVKATVDTVIKIHENEPFGDILAFLTSQEEILTARETLELYAEQNNEKNKYRKQFPSGILAANLSVLPMYGSLPVYKQIKVFQSAERNVRKVILATNIAETSITIPGIVYVIDCGFHKLPYYNASVGVDSLSVHVISKSNATQRAGRAGRQSHGKCYRLYTESEYDKLSESVPPEICRSDLSAILLQLKALGINNLLRFPFPTPPPAVTLLDGIETLYALWAIDKLGELTADVGVLMAELPLQPCQARMLICSGEYGCTEEALSIVSMLQVDNVFITSATGKTNMAARVAKRNNFEVAEGDIIMYLNILDSYLTLKRSYKDDKKRKKACKGWCDKMFLNYHVLERACEIRDNLEKLLNKFDLGIKHFDGPDLGGAKLERIMKCVFSGYFTKVAFLSIDGTYKTLKGATLHLSAAGVMPKWLIFTTVHTVGNKTYMRDIMSIDKEWITDLAPHYYTFK